MINAKHLMNVECECSEPFIQWDTVVHHSRDRQKKNFSDQILRYLWLSCMAEIYFFWWPQQGGGSAIKGNAVSDNSAINSATVMEGITFIQDLKVIKKIASHHQSMFATGEDGARLCSRPQRQK